MNVYGLFEANTSSSWANMYNYIGNIPSTWCRWSAIAGPDWKLYHAHGRSSVRTSNSTCRNENLGARIFVQEVLGAHVQQTKIKLYLSGFQVLWSIMT